MHQHTNEPGSKVRVRFMSDLHLEFTGYQPAQLPSAGEDLVILAGDIGTGTGGIEWAQKAFPDVPVLYVMGNHEFYGYDWEDLVREARLACDKTNVTLLEEDVFTYKGFRFMGATLWTDFLLGGPAARDQAMEKCRDFINDYRHIRFKGRDLHPRESIERHERTVAWLRATLALSSDPTVVITHHGPSIGARHPGFEIDELANVFVSDLPKDLFQAPLAWIYGHTHSSLNGQVHGMPLFSNQRGYPREKVTFSWDRLLELELELGSAGEPAKVRVLDHAG